MSGGMGVDCGAMEGAEDQRKIVVRVSSGPQVPR